MPFRSGNELMMRLEETKAQIQQEEQAKVVKELIQRNTRVCPGCETIQFIPESDYICEACRE